MKVETYRKVYIGVWIQYIITSFSQGEDSSESDPWVYIKMANLVQKIFSVLGVPAIALGISCSKPEDEGRCEYNDLGECVQTFRSSDGRYALDVTYGRSSDVTQVLTVHGMRDASCFYKIKKEPFGGLKILEHGRNCPDSLFFSTPYYFEFGREIALRIDRE